MRLPDIFPKFITEDYQTEKKDMILAAIDACESMEDMSKLISYGSFKIKQGEDYRYFEDAARYVKDNSDVEQALVKKTASMIKGDDDIIHYLSTSIHYVVDFDKILDIHRDLFTEFFMRELALVDGKIEFKSEKVKQFPLYKKVMNTILSHDGEAINKMFAQMVSELPTPKVKFDFSKAVGFSFRNSKVIEVSPKEFVSRLYHICIVAYYLDEFEGEDTARNTIFKSQPYKAFSRSLKNEIKKMLTITEANVYQDDYSVFLDSYGFSAFIDSLGQFIRMLEDAHEIGRDVFAWYYHLPRHGQVHGDKKRFLDTYQEVISRSKIMHMVKLESIFDDRSNLQDIIDYE